MIYVLSKWTPSSSSNFVIYRDADSNKFPIYASGRENIHYAHMNLELKKRQDFISMLFSFIMCRGLYNSPIAKDSVWLEIPLDRKADAG